MILYCGVSSVTFRCVTLECMASDASHTNCHLGETLKPKRWSIYINGSQSSEEGSRTSGRPFSDGSIEGCEVTGWLYFISALLLLFLTIIFLQVSYLTWSFSGGPITYHFGSLHANFIYPPFFPFWCVIFSPLALSSAALKNLLKIQQ